MSVRDLMELPPEEQSKVTLRALVRPVNFVPETKSVRDLLKGRGVAEDKIELKKPESITGAGFNAAEGRRVEVALQ